MNETKSMFSEKSDNSSLFVIQITDKDNPLDYIKERSAIFRDCIMEVTQGLAYFHQQDTLSFDFKAYSKIQIALQEILKNSYDAYSSLEKVTPREIVVYVGIIPTSDSAAYNKELVVAVQDYGEGINDFLSTLDNKLGSEIQDNRITFNPNFWYSSQREKQDENTLGGEGYGLTQTSIYIESLGGQLFLEANPSGTVGTTVYMKIPLVPMSGG